jgi:ADP-ribosyl-[dinitrogen reductase] hydrolase
MNKKDRLYGAFLGLAVGDAVGTTLEFKPRDSYEHLTDMVGGGPFRLPVGYWTDDTSMALCLAENIIANNGVEAQDLLTRFVDWYKNGANSSTGQCFDIGVTTITSLLEYEGTGTLVNNPEPWNAGNGSIMRLAPVAIAHHADLDQAYSDAILQSRTTHAAEECVESCMLLTNILLNAFSATTKEEVFNTHVGSLENVKNILTTLDVTRDEVKSSGYVIHTLHAALWAFKNTDNFRDAVLLAVNLGHDSDTVGAVAGQIAGAFYGMEGIPAEWLAKLHQTERFIELVDKLTDE